MEQAEEFFDIYANKRGFDTIDDLERLHAYRDQSHVLLTPTRGDVPIEAALSWLKLASPMNHPRGWFHRKRQEVAAAYNWLVDMALTDPTAKSYKWLVTAEDDNILPDDGLIELMAAIHQCPDCGQSVDDDNLCPEGHRGFDAISALYFTKSEPGMPMAYGDPAKADLSSGYVNFEPVSIRDAVNEGRVIEVNGIAMGFTLWRRSLFEEVSEPWFKTVNEDGRCDTQDLYFCRRAKLEAGARFGVHCGVRVGHIDRASGVIY